MEKNILFEPEKKVKETIQHFQAVLGIPDEGLSEYENAEKRVLFNSQKNSCPKLAEAYIQAMKVVGYDLTRVDDVCFFKNQTTGHEVGLDFEVGIYDYLHEMNLKPDIRAKVEEILPTAEYEIVDPFFSDGHLQFTLELKENGKTSLLEGLYRIHDTNNGPDNKLVTINSESFEQDMGVLFREWNRIEGKLKEMVCERNRIEEKSKGLNLDDIAVDIERSGFHPTKSLIENIEKFNRMSKENYSLKDIAKLKQKNPSFKNNPEKIECFTKIINECQNQEVNQKRKFIRNELKLDISHLPVAGM